jgi:hypothetical protein
MSGLIFVLYLAAVRATVISHCLSSVILVDAILYTTRATRTFFLCGLDTRDTAKLVSFDTMFLHNLPRQDKCGTPVQGSFTETIAHVFAQRSWLGLVPRLRHFDRSHRQSPQKRCRKSSVFSNPIPLQLPGPRGIRERSDPLLRTGRYAAP